MTAPTAEQFGFMLTGLFKCRDCGEIASMELQAPRYHFRCVYCIRTLNAVRDARQKLKKAYA